MPVCARAPVVILFGVVVLKDALTPLSGLGVVLAMGGGLWYGKARARIGEGLTPPPGDKSGKGEAEKDDKALAPLLRAGAEAAPRDEGASTHRA